LKPLQNSNSKFGAVTIGRNEGKRLRQCLNSLAEASPATVIYVDFGSTDDSVHWARSRGAEVIELDPSKPFTAARARNIGFQRFRKLNPNISYVQFVDGDCELIKGWTEAAIEFLESHADVAAVCGKRHERYPDRSIYNWLVDRSWDGPIGEIRACGGDAMMRACAVAEVGGYRDDVLAGEEAELCFRLRAGGWHIWRVDLDMTLHDIAMSRFTQWWRRTLRAGHGYAQGAYLHGGSVERHLVRESCRAWLWGFFLPLACLTTGLLWGPWGWAAWLIYPIQLLRQILRNRGSLRERTIVASFQMLSRFAEVCGQARFFYDLLRGRQVRLIEYR
jgi:glycosyltransferase involved in cell wall biosynthesis